MRPDEDDPDDAYWLGDPIPPSPWDDDPPFYPPGFLAGLDEAGLQHQWEVQCGIHDRGVDRLPLGHPTIEDAAMRLRLIEAEQKQRGFEPGPSPDRYGAREGA